MTFISKQIYSTDIDFNVNSDENKHIKSTDGFITVLFRKIYYQHLLFEKAIYYKLSLNKNVYNKIKKIGSLNSKISLECIYN